MKLQKPLRVGIIAPSSVLPAQDFERGVEHLRKLGFVVEVHSTVLGQDYFYPASDSLRAKAFFDFAMRTDLDILWCARGGYGATHLLPALKKLSARKKPKKKTLIGFSDATALLEFTRMNWGWKSIHAPMPSLKTFSDLKESEWESILQQIELAYGSRKAKDVSSASSFSLTPVFTPKKHPQKILAPLTGGNLAVWNTLIGTPFKGKASGKILFLEEIQENIARINRMIHHLEQSGGLKGVKAIVLGDFIECRDTVALGANGQPIRRTYTPEEALHYVFSSLGERLQIPVWKGVPSGHGTLHSALSFGAKYELTSKGELKLKG